MSWLGTFVALAGLLAVGIATSKSDEELRAEREEADRLRREEEQRAQEKALRDKRLADSVKFVTTGEFHRDYHIDVEKGWIKTEADSRGAAEWNLRLEAAKVGANGITRLNYIKHHERHQAGVGPKGNPYYESRTITTWEGCAVKVSEPGSNDRASARLAPPTNNLAAIDGSNILYATGRNPDLASVEAVVEKLKMDGYKPHVFFDANIGYTTFKRPTSTGELAERLGVQSDQITIVPAGKQADPFILDFARLRGATVISNDRYRDYAVKTDGVTILSVAFIGPDVYIN